MIAKIFEERVNNLLKDAKKQLGKKRPHVNGTTIPTFFLPNIFIKRMMCKRSNFWKI
jgi:hypothetical protein